MRDLLELFLFTNITVSFINLSVDMAKVMLPIYDEIWKIRSEKEIETGKSFSRYYPDKYGDFKIFGMLIKKIYPALIYTLFSFALMFFIF